MSSLGQRVRHVAPLRAPLLILVAVVLVAVTVRRIPVPKHVVLVVLDTARADRMSVYGHRGPTTPFLKRVDGSLLKYTHAQAAAPWTVPSHATMFTGLLPASHGAQWGNLELPDNVETLAEVLKGQGFCTMGVTANRFIGPKAGFDQGFDRLVVLPQKQTRKSERILSRFRSYMRRATTRRCRQFVFLNFMDAHIPYNHKKYGGAMGVKAPVPVRHALDKWRVNGGQLPFDPAAKAQHRLAYDAAIRYLDDVAKEVWSVLEEQGLLDDTLVIFTSDHGEGLGYHTTIGHSFTVWEEQLHVPLLVRLPGAHRGGEIVEDRISMVGLTPSILDWLAIPRPSQLAGRPTLEGTARGPIVADYRNYFSETDRSLNMRLGARFPKLAQRTTHRQVVYCGDHKLIVGADGTRQLFDLRSDPREEKNLASSLPRTLERCLETHAQALAEGLLTPFDRQRPTKKGSKDEPMIDHEMLRSLGYAQ